MARKIAQEGARASLNLDMDTVVMDLEHFDAFGSFGALEPTAALLQGLEPYDLIVACHSVNELWPKDIDAITKRRDFLFRVASLLRDGGILLIIEPSAHATSIPLLALRDSLLATAAAAYRYAPLTVLRCCAPCPHTMPCPLRALENRPCFSEWPWMPPPLVADLAARAGLDRSSLKAAWVAFKTIKPVPQTQPEPQHQLQRAAGYCLQGRIVSAPMRNKAGRIRFIVCAATGQLITFSAPQDDRHAQELGFFALRRGDLIDAHGLLERGPNHLAIGPLSGLSVLMSPLPLS